MDAVRAKYPGIQVIVHPECRWEVCQKADALGSTERLIELVEKAPEGSMFAIGTEIHLVNRLARRFAPKGKKIITLDDTGCLCTTMYRISPQHLAWALENLVEGRVVNRIQVGEDVKHWARVALDRMLEIGVPRRRHVRRRCRRRGGERSKTFTLKKRRRCCRLWKRCWGRRSLLERAGELEAEMQALSQRIFLSGGTPVNVARRRPTEAEAQGAGGKRHAGRDRGHRCADQGLRSRAAGFPCIIEGKTVLLCWQRGERRLATGTLEDGFAGRKPLDSRFGSGTRAVERGR